MQNIPQNLSDKLDSNTKLMDKYGFYATPAIVWKNAKGEIESQQGAPKDLKKIFPLIYKSLKMTSSFEI